MGLQPIMSKFLSHRLLITTDSPCSTPILAVKKKDSTYCLVQDLYIINEANSEETVADFILGGSQITADGDCSHEIKRPLGGKVMINLDSMLKSRHISVPTKVHLVKAMVFPVVMHGCESWTVKKAEHRRINAFELWC